MAEADNVTIEVEIESALADVVRQAVASGDYASSDDVVAAALRDWLEKRQRRASAIKKLQDAWDEGVASGIAPHRRTAEEIIADGRRKLAARKSA